MTKWKVLALLFELGNFKYFFVLTNCVTTTFSLCQSKSTLTNNLLIKIIFSSNKQEVSHTMVFSITFTLLNKQKWMYLVINLRGEETFSSTTPPLMMYSLIHLDPWWCIRQYMLTPDNVLCIEFLTCEKSNTQFFFSQDCRENVSP